MKQFTRLFSCLSLMLALLGAGSIASKNNNSCSVSLDDCSKNRSCDDSSSNDCRLTSSLVRSCACHSTLIGRSAHDNTAYFWVAPRKDLDCDFNGTLELGVEYTRSFSSKGLAQCLFGSNALHFQGSQVVGRDANALIADNFGLSQNCDTTLRIKPMVQNFNLHFATDWRFSNWVEGLYGQVNFTFSHQKRTLASESNSSDCTAAIQTSTGCATPFPAGYMGAAAANPAPDVKTALGGQTLFGDMNTAWAFGKFRFCDQTVNRVAGVSLIFGYNFWQSDCGHFGAFLRYVAPTGNTPDPRFVFSPVVGNGKHHEIGGGITAGYEVWNNGCNQTLGLYLDGYIVTLLKKCQIRSFDFAGKGCLSRYMLLKALKPSANTAFVYDYAGSLVNGINFATRYTDVKVNVKGDATLRLAYTLDEAFRVAVGYNLYGQSEEKLCLKPNNKPVTYKGAQGVDPNALYGFKGCNGTNCFTYALNGSNQTTATPVVINSLNATSSNATITSCGTTDTPVTTFIPLTSACVDWKQPNALTIPTGTAQGTLVTANTSDPAIAIATPMSSRSCSSSCNDSSSSDCGMTTITTGTTAQVLDLRSGKAPSQLSHKGFVTFDYTWKDCDWLPYLGVGVEAEGSGRRCTVKQWGVWVKGGIQF